MQVNYVHFKKEVVHLINFLIIKSFQRNEKPTQNYGLCSAVQCHYHYHENAIRHVLETPRREYFACRICHTLDKSKIRRISHFLRNQLILILPCQPCQLPSSAQ